MPVRALNSSADRCEPLPGGDVPMLSLPGSRLASAMNSATLFAGNDGLAMMPMLVDANMPTGAKSLRVS